MTTCSQKTMYVENKRYNNNNEQEIERDRWRQISTNLYVYEKEEMTDEEFNKLSQQYNKNKEQSTINKYKYKNFKRKEITIDDFNNRTEDYYNNKYHSKSMEISAKRNYFFENKDNNLSDHMNQHTNNTKKQQKKTPISVLNEWAMRGTNGVQKKIVVSYVPLAISGFAHKPIFTFMCQVLNKKAKGEGLSKKEAKQEAAAEILKMIFEEDSLTNSDKNITSTTVIDNFEINENNTENLTSTEGSQIADSDMGDNEMQYSKNYEDVKISHCEMNPVGALQELCIKHKWASPIYNFQKISEPLKNTNRKVVSYIVTCQLFHLQTTGTANKQKNAKRMAAHMMFNQIHGMSVTEFQELNMEHQILSHDNDCLKNSNYTIMQEENKKSWDAVHIMGLYFKTAIVNSSIMEWSNLCSFFDDKTQQEIPQNIHQLEQSVEQYNSDSRSDVYKLQTLCEALGFQAIYVHVKSVFQPQKDVYDCTSQNEEYIMILQVNTIPITITVGRALTIDMAKEVAAKCVLNTFKTMLFSLSRSQTIIV
ncbi:Hypothetical protein CINCED_3A003642 [Cinara cedri]|nr:Hypothetical protein CINCED_3A003642 [Cinara cedri]